MPVTVRKKEGEFIVELEGAVTIRHAREVFVTFSEASDRRGSVTVATARLRDIDTSILQLLCSLRNTVPAVSFEPPSAEFVAAVDRCGLRDELLGVKRQS